MNPKTIHKCRSDRCYTKISNALLQNDTLSYQARGLMAYILSLPDDWEIYVTFLSEHGGKKRSVRFIKNCLKELNALGYMHIFPMIDAITHKAKGSRWVAFDEPKTPEAAKSAYLGTTSGADPITFARVGELQATKETKTYKKGNITKKISEKTGCILQLPNPGNTRLQSKSLTLDSIQPEPKESSAKEKVPDAEYRHSDAMRKAMEIARKPREPDPDDVPFA